MRGASSWVGSVPAMEAAFGGCAWPAFGIRLNSSGSITCVNGGGVKERVLGQQPGLAFQPPSVVAETMELGCVPYASGCVGVASGLCGHRRRDTRSSQRDYGMVYRSVRHVCNRGCLPRTIRRR